jgi:hypothetical protein
VLSTHFLTESDADVFSTESGADVLDLKSVQKLYA